MGGSLNYYDSWYDYEWLKQLTEETFPKDKNQPKQCEHEWLAVRLIYSTVYDCKKCGCKKESEK
jgi:hypothetical protein